MLWYHLVRRSSYCLGQWSSGLTGSLLGARCEQVGQRLSCDVLWDTDADKGEEFRGGGSIFIQRQKQDRFGYGINPRFPPGAYARRLRRWMNQMSLLPQPGCEKAHGSAAPCRVCPPLFPKVVKGPWDPSTQQRPQAVSAQMVSDAVKATLGLLWAICFGPYYDIFFWSRTLIIT